MPIIGRRSEAPQHRCAPVYRDLIAARIHYPDILEPPSLNMKILRGVLRDEVLGGHWLLI